MQHGNMQNGTMQLAVFCVFVFIFLLFLLLASCFLFLFLNTHCMRVRGSPNNEKKNQLTNETANEKENTEGKEKRENVLNRSN